MKDLLVAIETGGTKFQMSLGTAAGEIVYNHRVKIKKEEGFQGIMDMIDESVPLIQAQAKAFGGKIVGAGVGFGGPVDTRKGTVIFSSQINGWDGCPLGREIEKRLGVPAFIFNDSRAATWGEYKLGAGRGAKIFFYTNLGSGIGGGLVADSQLFNGQGYGAAEIGHSYIFNPFGGDPAVSNYQHQTEYFCSGWGIERRIKNDDIPEDSLLWKLSGGEKEKIDSIMWGEAVKQEDPYSLRVLDETAELFSIALSNALCFFSADVIAIGGGVSLIGEPLISRLRKYTEKYVYKNSEGRYRITNSVLGESVVLIGTLLLTAEQILGVGGTDGHKTE